MTIYEQRFFETAASFFSKHSREKKEIDWEQRRYELIKDIACARFGKDYGSFKAEDVPAFAKRMADAIIEELKR